MTEATRTDRRRMRTRAALLGAARTVLAEGRTNVPVLEITQAADVGLGSFYNHFDSKDELFQAVLDEALEQYGDLLDRLTADIADPAVVFATSLRLTGRLQRLEPEVSRVILNNGLGLVNSSYGLAPRALRDITAAAAAGRFQVADPVLALHTVAGAVLGLATLLHAHPERDDAADADQLAHDILRMFGLDAADADAICALPLPDITDAVHALPADA
jgi:AcrR family transcriptional regulator